MRAGFVVVGALAAVCGTVTGCARDDQPARTATVTVAAAAPPVTPIGAPAGDHARPVVDPAGTDFRMVQLDPSVIGSTAKCDIGRVEVLERAPGVLVHCSVDHRDSRIGLAVTREVVPALTPRTQIEVRIDGPGERGTDADAVTTFVRITGERPEPEPPSRCLCDRDRELAREAERPARPEGWDFARFERARETYWGTRQICVISNVSEIGRSSPTAREYSVGRVFEPEELPYAATVWCRSSAGSSRVEVGSTSAYSILALDRDQAIEVELGWSRHGVDPTGRLGGIRWRPQD